ncbi:hypothetical protein GBV73_09365 [Thermococcus sp. 101 C5]|jgi:hypothetical protein|nr:hypothetical protein [Thermococcus sp. 101 C5]MBC7108935.1 hypothetical protein [Methanomassiliicoccales archaeon]MCA6213608.1 hypothetical protein [Thermococcus bergensis]MDK2783981.1 hypothetical protein [Thermococcaceae archaeon]MDK2984183.1 hypothetical protein [Thermococcaceae archaeon]MPW39867.1 hypothetical protein [Thermococcus sp. 101 C5]
MKAFLSIFLISLVVFSSLCINRASTGHSSHPEPAQEVTAFLTEAKKNIKECNTTLKKPLAPWSEPEYLNMTVLNGTTLKLGGKIYRYTVLGIWNVSFSGEANSGEYKIIWEQLKNLTTTGGHEIDFKIYKGSAMISSFTYWYVPFQLDSFCVVVSSKSIKLPNGDTLTFIFMHVEKGDLWIALLG